MEVEEKILKVGMPKRVSSEDFEEIKKSDLQLPKYNESYENLYLDLFMVTAIASVLYKKLEQHFME